MSDVSKTSSTMKNQLKSQETEISKLRGRLNQLVDNIAVLENDLGMFKKNVSKDLLDVIDSLKEKQDRS
jgi:predicted RNase H-like nuclease (RuvC/YqgF family)|tara:strand:- start:242 stop:448 length:207 start_codon:yes stop_codon:yes gene_type:complete